MKFPKHIKQVKSVWITAVILTAICVPAAVSAASGEISVYSYPENAVAKLTVFSEFPLYDRYDKPGKPVGTISPVQTLKLKAHAAIPDAPDAYSTNIYNDWFLVETTWIGDKWIHMTDGISKYGEMVEQPQTITFVDETVLYDAPAPSQMTELKLSAQKVQANASITACEPFSKNFYCDNYYRIDTWLGEKWIAPSNYLEKIKEEPLHSTITLTNETEVYELPFFNKKTGTKLKPQTLKVISKYWVVLGRAGPVTWYKVETPAGIRWIEPYDAYVGMEQINGKIKIPVAFHFYSRPNEYSQEEKWEQPTELQATGKLGVWYYVRSSASEYRWINPERALAENPSDVKSIRETILINERSYVANIPYAEPNSSSHLTFSEQSVTAAKKWSSPQGVTWYFISTWQGDKWVRP